MHEVTGNDACSSSFCRVTESTPRSGSATAKAMRGQRVYAVQPDPLHLAQELSRVDLREEAAPAGSPLAPTLAAPTPARRRSTGRFRPLLGAQPRSGPRGDSAPARNPDSLALHAMREVVEPVFGLLSVAAALNDRQRREVGVVVVEPRFVPAGLAAGVCRTRRFEWPRRGRPVPGSRRTSHAAVAASWAGDGDVGGQPAEQRCPATTFARSRSSAASFQERCLARQGALAESYGASHSESRLCYSPTMQGQFDSRCSPSSAIASLRAVREAIEQGINQALGERGRANRSSSDDQVFGNFNTSLAIGLGRGLASFYLDLARDIDEQVRRFEEEQSTEVHKGSLYFNAAVCALVNQDFDVALYYFAAAGREDSQTSGHTVADMFLVNELFRKWVTKKLHEMLEAEGAQVSGTTDLLLPGIYTEHDIDAFLGTLPLGVLGAVIVSLCRFVASRSLQQVNDGSSIVRYRVVVELCVAYEVTLKTWVRNQGLSPKNTLGQVLHNDLSTTRFGDISAYADATFAPKGTMWPCRNLSDYDALLSSGVLASIDAESDPRKKAAQLICFVTHTRNQVVHDLDPTAAIFKNDQLCQDVARRVLVALCLNAYL